MAKKKKRTTFAKARKGKVGRGKPKGTPPQALRRKKRSPRIEPPKPRDIGLLDAVGEVIADVEELGQEMRDWADNMPESKQGSSKYDEVDTAASTLEEQSGSDPVDHETMSFLNDVKFEWQDPAPKRRGYSRSARLGHVNDLLTEIITQLETYIGDKDGPNETIAGELKDSLENIESELLNVDFPGMFG